MAPLTTDRQTQLQAGNLRDGPVAAGQLIFAGSLVCRNAAGYLVKGATAVGLTGVGCAEVRCDNSAGAAGDVRLLYRPGIFLYANSAAGDLIALTEIGKVCFVVDDQTVAKTDGGATRSRAGIVENVDAQGVWVRIDEALTRAA